MYVGCMSVSLFIFMCQSQIIKDRKMRLHRMKGYKELKWNVYKLYRDNDSGVML